MVEMVNFVYRISWFWNMQKVRPEIIRFDCGSKFRAILGWAAHTSISSYILEGESTILAI
jgi:hypothetical protein